MIMRAKYNTCCKAAADGPAVFCHTNGETNECSICAALGVTNHVDGAHPRQ